MADQTSNELVLKISIEEANIILEGLGELPFKKSFAMVNKIQQTAAAQLGSNSYIAEEPALEQPDNPDK